MDERAKRFEDLQVWQKARLLTREIYTLTRQRAFDRDLALARQMQRASVSIMSNVAEGFDRHGSAEFHHFVSVASGSCAEVQSHLYVALDAGFVREEEFKRLYEMTAEVGRMLSGLRASLKSASTKAR